MTNVTLSFGTYTCTYILYQILFGSLPYRDLYQYICLIVLGKFINLNARNYFLSSIDFQLPLKC